MNIVRLKIVNEFCMKLLSSKIKFHFFTCYDIYLYILLYIYIFIIYTYIDVYNIYDLIYLDVPLCCEGVVNLLVVCLNLNYLYLSKAFSFQRFISTYRPRNMDFWASSSETKFWAVFLNRMFWEWHIAGINYFHNDRCFNNEKLHRKFSVSNLL